MRLAFLVLLLANLALFAWSRGYWGAQETGREPERLQRQVTPERLRVLPAMALPVCRRIEWLSAAEAKRLQEGIAALPGWSAEQLPRVEPPAHWVVMPELTSRALAERKIAELRQLGVNEGEIVEDAALGPFAVSLGVFRGRQTAEEHLQSLVKKGVRSARLARRDLSPERFALELVAPQGELAEKLPTLLAGLDGMTVGECPPR